MRPNRYIIAFILTFGCPFASVAAGPSCQVVFSHQGSQLAPLPVSISHEELKRLETTPHQVYLTMRIANTKTPFHGGFLREIKADHGLWSSGYAESGNDLLGCPLCIGLVVPPEVALAMGIGKAGAYIMTAPDVTGLNAFLETMNQHLEQAHLPQMKLRFYETSEHKPINGHEYLQNMAGGRLPLESSGSLAIHDISYHMMLFLMPRFLIDRVQTNAQLVLHFAEELKKVPSFAGLASELVEAAVTEIDSMGDIVGSLGFVDRPQPDHWDEGMHGVRPPAPTKDSDLNSAIRNRNLHLKPDHYIQFLFASRRFEARSNAILLNSQAFKDIWARFIMENKKIIGAVPELPSITFVETVKKGIQENIENLTATVRGVTKKPVNLPGIIDSNELWERSHPSEEDILSLRDSGEPFYGGGFLREIHTKSSTWNSNFAANVNDVEGCPLCLALLLHPEALRVMGIGKLSKDVMTVPDVKSLNFFLDNLSEELVNAKLPNLGLRFYETDTSRPLTDLAYVRNLAAGKLPLEKNGSVGIHDISFHMMLLLMPKVLLDRVIADAQVILTLHNRLAASGDPKMVELAQFLTKSAAARFDFLADLTTSLTSSHPQSASDLQYQTLVGRHFEDRPEDFTMSLMRNGRQLLAPAGTIQQYLGDGKYRPNPSFTKIWAEFLAENSGLLDSFPPAIVSPFDKRSEEFRSHVMQGFHQNIENFNRVVQDKLKARLAVK